MRNKGIYQFTYENGMTQQKVLISHLWWIYSKLLPEKGQKRCLKCVSGDNEWFTDQSPLYEAISTGKLKIYNGEYKPCKVEHINNNNQNSQ